MSFDYSYSSAVSIALVDHYLVDEDEGVVAVLGHVVADGFVLDVAGFGVDCCA